MPRISNISPGSEIYDSIYKDFKNRTFDPFGKVIGGVNHYRSREIYQTVTPTVFRSHAQAIARKICAQSKLSDYDDDDDDQSDLAMKIKGDHISTNTKKISKKARSAPELSDDEDDYNQSSRARTIKGEQIKTTGNPPKVPKQTNDSSDEDDENYTSSINESLSDEGLDGFDEIQVGEILNSRQPFLTEYPTRDKVLAIFPLDGNVIESDGNKFEFDDDYKAIRRLGKIPKERESCVDLIGDGKEQPTKMGFESADLMVVDAEIKKRLQANQYKRDDNGDIWEIRATLELPFRCDPQLRDRQGRVMKTFRMQSNALGFRWGYFWLLASKPPTSKPAKRIGGTLVTVKGDSSIYTEETYKSDKKKTKK